MGVRDWHSLGVTYLADLAAWANVEDKVRGTLDYLATLETDPSSGDIPQYANGVRRVLLEIVLAKRIPPTDTRYSVFYRPSTEERVDCGERVDG